MTEPADKNFQNRLEIMENYGFDVSDIILFNRDLRAKFETWKARHLINQLLDVLVVLAEENKLIPAVKIFDRVVSPLDRYMQRHDIMGVTGYNYFKNSLHESLENMTARNNLVGINNVFPITGRPVL